MPDAPAFVLLSDSEIHEVRQRLIAANGEMEAAGISLETMRNVIYTCRMKANPMQEQGDAPKERKAKTPSTNKATLSGDAINDFLS